MVLSSLRNFAPFPRVAKHMYALWHYYARVLSEHRPSSFLHMYMICFPYQMCNVIWFGLQKSQSEQRNNVQHSTLNTRSNLPSNIQCLMACLIAGLPWDTGITISSCVVTRDNSDSSNSWRESCYGGLSDCSVESSDLSFSDQGQKNTSELVRVTYGIVIVLWCGVFALQTLQVIQLELIPVRCTVQFWHME